MKFQSLTILYNCHEKLILGLCKSEPISLLKYDV